MGHSSQATSAKPRPIIVDTDLSFDDYVALIYLLQNQNVDVRAITVVNGVVHVKPGIENIRRLLSLTGRTDIPFAGGPEKPLSGQRAFPAHWRFILDYALRLILPRHSLPAPQKKSAAELICQQVSTSETPITFIALGPLTNLALALRADPTLATRVDSVLISGGAIYTKGTIRDDVPSHPNVVAEWNLYIDPTAAEAVFNSGARLELVPLDVTHTNGSQPLLFTHEFVNNLSTLAHERTTKTIVRILRLWQLLNPRRQAFPMWDAAAAAIAVDATIGSDWRDLAVSIALEPDGVAGQTIVDEDDRPNARVCLAGDQVAFEEAFLATIR
jgi:inosine-uridine nucleoside N-ribohydrolase